MASKTKQKEEFIQTPTLDELKQRETQIFNELGVITIQLEMLNQQREMLEERKTSLVREQRHAVELYNSTVQSNDMEQTDSTE